MIFLICIVFAVSSSVASHRVDVDTLKDIKLILQRHEDEIRKLTVENNALKAQASVQDQHIKGLNDKVMNLKSQVKNLIENGCHMDKGSTILRKEMIKSKQDKNVINTYVKIENKTTKPSPERTSQILVHHSRETSILPNGLQNKRLLMNSAVDPPVSMTTVDPPVSMKTAFTAGLGEHMTIIGLHQTIIFERVKANVGNAYTPVTGVFTAPSNGTYFFTATIMCHSGDFLEAEIVHNGAHVVYMYASDSNFEQGTNSAVLVLAKGDHVWVRNVRVEAHKVYGHDWSTFSGFILFE